MKVCGVDGCERKVLARGWCSMHWQRWNKTGSLGEADTRRTKLPDVCKMQGCENRPVGRQMCAKHYERWRQHGHPLGHSPTRVVDHPDTCEVDGCGLAYYASGMCCAHYNRVRAHGDPKPERPIGPARQEEHASYRGDNAGYITVHWRMRKANGPASNKRCQHCDSTASDWAYDHGDPDEKLSAEGLQYSTKQNHYIPLCRSCHINFDINWRKNQGAAA